MYTIKFTVVCGVTKFKATNTSQVLVSPGYPHEYFSNLDCMWTISTENNSAAAIILKFDSFDVS